MESLRAFALDCHPWFENSLTLSFLTDREAFDEAKHGKWCMAEWRFYNFTGSPTGNRQSASSLIAEAYAYYAAALRNNTQAACHAKLLAACVAAMKAESTSTALKDYKLAPDFECFVGHPDAPSHNFYAA